MKASFYNFFFEYNGDCYIYNTLSSSIVSSNVETVKIIKNNRISELTLSDIDVLYGQGIIVDDEVDEYELYKKFYTKLQDYPNTDSLILTVIPTYGCNLMCTYCYQGDLNHTANNTFSSFHIKSFTQFINKQLFFHKNIKEVAIRLFGGEPLVYAPQLIELLNQIRFILDKKIDFRTNITTNGTLISQQIIDQLIIPNKMHLQLTVDGIEANHDKKRIYKNGEGTFKKITEIIKLLNSNNLKDRITLRINVDKSNILDIPSLIDTFKPLVGRIYLATLNSQGRNSNNADNCITNIQLLEKLDANLMEYVLPTKDSDLDYHFFGKRSPCSFNSFRSVYIIDYFLNVYSCDALAGLSDYSIGKIDENGDITMNDNFLKQKSSNPFSFPKCINCKLLPFCAGGCAYHRYCKNGNIYEPFCERSEAELLKYLRLYIDKFL